jgi:virginiamycin B lyase
MRFYTRNAMNKRSTLILVAISAVFIVAWGQSASNQAPALVAWVDEFPLVNWPKHDDPKLDYAGGSTHEITYNHKGGDVFWVTGQKHDALARITLDGKPTFFKMPDGSGPHGIIFDADGQLWVTLEFKGTVVQIDQTSGKVLREIDVRLIAKGSDGPINTHPHGLGLGPDGKTLWFTGKSTGTVGRINPNGSVDHFPLPTVGSVPIYIVAGPDGAMWCTELVGNAIARITADGKVAEFPIGPTAKRPDGTPNSRPIAITAAPDGKSMWFSEEAGNKVGRIGLDGSITEFPVPKLHGNTILAALTFDKEGNLWTQAYIDPNNDLPAGADAIVKIDKAILSAADADISSIPVTFYQVPTRDTVMHRITQGPDGALWFTELAVDQVGRLEFIPAAEAAKRPPPQKSSPNPSAALRKRAIGHCD